jgi:hypothetical protein
MKRTFWGALVGAVMLALAAPASATTVTGTSSVNALGAFAPGASTNFGAGATGTNVASFGGGKTFYDYIFSFTLTGTGDVTVSSTATPNGPYAFTEHYAALFNSSPVSGQVPGGSSLTDANAADISLTNTASLLTLGNNNGGALTTLTLNAGTYYLRLFGLLPGNINSGHALSSIGGNLSIAAVAVAATPIPAALPLFASALGLFGFMGWRRKSAATAAA